MGLIDTLQQRFLTLLEEALAPIIGPIKGIISIVTSLRENTIGIFTAGTKLTLDVQAEYKAIRDFKSKPHWKSRVVSAPLAFDNIKRLVSDVPQSFIRAVKDLINQLKNKLEPAKLNLDELEGVEDLRTAFKRFGTKLARGLEKLLGIVALVVDALVTVKSTIDDLQTIVDDIKEVRKDIENLDGLFLPQNNRRRVVTSEIGPMKIRVGNLHA